ncbi:hypothetical protein [Sphingomonas arenae]|uniref:hypothetical protein n=1 Tax=Sphingomonas arenae TaxID=2812555 RepID=UPI001967DDF7|nr:hypothetical protein [Sphingomonas arenae]
MTTIASARRGPGFGSLLLLALVLLLAGAAGATWALARWHDAARFLGVTAPAPQPATTAMAPGGTTARLVATPEAADARVAQLEARLARVENATQTAVGSAGRADALLVAFAARRAIDRGVPLGYLEALLVDRFGASHPRAVATIVTASRTPVRLDQLQADYDALAPQLKGGGPQESVWSGLQRELSSLVTVRRADTPSPRPNATYERARGKLASGHVDQALVETMRLPGVARAQPWVDRARAYVTAHRALDEIESAALLGAGR